MQNNAIRGFFNEFRFLSNFYPVNITYETILYPSVEHAYQACKTDSLDIKILIAKIDKPELVKKISRYINLIDNWDNKKLSIMEELIRLKFNNDNMKELLLMTNGLDLIEENNWGDTFWGICNGKGENNLGKLLMKVRNELKTN